MAKNDGLTPSEKQLARDVGALLVAVKQTIKHIFTDEVTVGGYDPSTVPASIYIQGSLDEHQRLRALVHELTHACLHPPGRDDFNEAVYLLEEPCSHEAAIAVCSDYGITDYFKVMVGLGVPLSCFQDSHPNVVETMIQRVGSALKQPHKAPDWAEAVTRARPPAGQPSSEQLPHGRARGG
jgi:hypothetical protein